MYAQYRSVLGKRPLLGKRPCTAFHGVNVAASIQMYGIYMYMHISGISACGPKSPVMLKHPWALTWDTMVQTPSLALMLGSPIHATF